MKTYLFTATKPTRYLRVLPAIFLSVFLVTACEKPSESETVNESTPAAAVQTTPVTSNINAPTVTDDDANATAETTVDSKQDVSLNELEKDLEPMDSAASNAAAPNPEQAIKGAQITDVRYKSAAGESLSVVFETSAAGVLNAIVALPNKPKMTLSAPEGQGNNPTYRSSDGNIQLVSHAGGGSIDFIRNNKVTSFDAVSAEAEVITE